MNAYALEKTPRAEDVAKLEVCIQREMGNRVRDLRLVPYAGGLILQGFCETYYAKQLAQHAVLAATDLPLIANRIVVT